MGFNFVNTICHVLKVFSQVCQCRLSALRKQVMPFAVPAAQQNTELKKLRGSADFRVAGYFQMLPEVSLICNPNINTISVQE